MQHLDVLAKNMTIIYKRIETIEKTLSEPPAYTPAPPTTDTHAIDDIRIDDIRKQIDKLIVDGNQSKKVMENVITLKTESYVTKVLQDRVFTEINQCNILLDAIQKEMSVLKHTVDTMQNEMKKTAVVKQSVETVKVEEVDESTDPELKEDFEFNIGQKKKISKSKKSNLQVSV